MLVPMKQVTVIKNNFSILNAPNGTAIVIGNFDGVHKGHQALLEKLARVSKSKSLTPCVYTFYPHPKKFFKRLDAPKKLMSLEQKISKLALFGAEVVVVKPFNLALSSLTFEEYIQHLKNDLNVKCIIVGEDFVFGKGRSGNAEKLKELAPEYGFEVEIIEDVIEKNGLRYSSTQVRERLIEGNVKDAGLELGEPVTYKTYLYEDDYCNLIAHLSGYSPIKKGVYFAKVQYTGDPQGYEPVVVPVTIKGDKAFIAPLAEMPDLKEGRVYLSLIDNIEK